MTRKLTTLFISMISISSLGSSVAAHKSPCADTLSLASNDSIHRSTPALGSADCFHTTQEEPGVWHIAVSGSRPDSPVLSVTDSQGRLLESEILTRSPHEKTLFTESGSFVLRVQAQDPSQNPGTYRLVSRFVSLSKDEEDPGELELESEGLDARINPYDHTKDEEDPGELELESEGLDAPPSADPLRAALCSGDVSDGDDSLLCARALDLVSHSRWDGDRAEDVDVYRFSTDSWQTLRWVVSADAVISARLFDDRGQALGTGAAEGELISTRYLAPGVYFLQLSADRPASYRVTLEALP